MKAIVETLAGDRVFETTPYEVGRGVGFLHTQSGVVGNNLTVVSATTEVEENLFARGYRAGVEEGVEYWEARQETRLPETLTEEEYEDARYCAHKLECARNLAGR